jgi:hypothetical protein
MAACKPLQHVLELNVGAAGLASAWEIDPVQPIQLVGDPDATQDAWRTVRHNQ